MVPQPADLKSPRLAANAIPVVPDILHPFRLFAAKLLAIASLHLMGSQGCSRMAEPGRAPGRTQGFAGTWPPREAAGGFAPSGFGAWPHLLAKLREWIRAEAGAGRLLPWVPVAFGTGIAFYFAADHEPVLPVAAVTAAAS